MNIFKVFASAKKGFQEEYSSAILAWFLNPTMEHGLGFSFLSKFIEEISEKIENNYLKIITERLSPRFRSEYENQLQWSCYLEYNVENAFVDVVLRIDDLILSIENKIYGKSASDEDQLMKQYDGLKRKYGENYKIGIVFVVPTEGEGVLHPYIESEYNKLDVKGSDFKIMITWQRNSIANKPSIYDIISSILDAERKGDVDPIPEYTRHTLKAFNSFISNNFLGYEYERSSSYSGKNPLTEETCKIKDLLNRSEGFVGVANGIAGLLRMEDKKLKTHEFQYTRADMSNKRNWILIRNFNNIIRWLIYGDTNDIDWDVRLEARLLFRIAKDFKDNVFIGIKGGKTALMDMLPDEIRRKRWSINTVKGSDQWIDGGTFFNIMEQKKIF